MDSSDSGSDLLPLLLEVCEDLFVHAGQAARDELDDLLHARGIKGGRGWLIDMLALTRRRLQTRPQSGESRADEPERHR
ncbi:hypothetical protein [Actinoplanes sp. HUAS TT8]|uniref:hypothetical protein n=1 Tax=Actinoplanes sp. HUAS TT8 TaxID=3447453 RepID=UPI003F526E39